jgi:glucose-6-phosphate 1-dehydrogenase
MRIRVSPDMSIGMGVRVKTPGERMVGHDLELLVHRQAANDIPPYERLLGDASRGNSELFSRQDIIEAQWRIVEPVLGSASPLYQYDPGSWGPGEAEQLIEGYGPWVNPVVETSEPATIA